MIDLGLVIAFISGIIVSAGAPLLKKLIIKALKKIHLKASDEIDRW